MYQNRDRNVNLTDVVLVLLLFPVTVKEAKTPHKIHKSFDKAQKGLCLPFRPVLCAQKEFHFVRRNQWCPMDHQWHQAAECAVVQDYQRGTNDLNQLLGI